MNASRTSVTSTPVATASPWPTPARTCWRARSGRHAGGWGRGSGRPRSGAVVDPAGSGVSMTRSSDERRLSHIRDDPGRTLMCARGLHAIIPLVHLPGLDRISRQRQGRVIAGVCAGLARGLALDASVVRLGMLLLSLAGGFGVLVYGGLWLALPVDDDPAPARPVHRVDDVAALAVVLGGMLVLRAAGVWVTDAVAIVGGIAAVGVVLVWGRSGGTESPARNPTAAVRIAVGVALVIVGFI